MARSRISHGLFGSALLVLLAQPSLLAQEKFGEVIGFSRGANVSGRSWFTYSRRLPGAISKTLPWETSMPLTEKVARTGWL